MAQLIHFLLSRVKPAVIVRSFLFMAIMCLLFSILFVLRNAQAQNTEHTEVEWRVKAAYLYKFGSYIVWPPETFTRPEAQLNIGIVNADAIADELMKIIPGRTINGHPLTVRKLRLGEPMTGFNILFIGSAHIDNLTETLTAVKGLPILTVTDSEVGFNQGSMINFVIIDGKLRFEIAPKAASTGKLAISARLLSVAYKVASESL